MPEIDYTNFRAALQNLKKYYQVHEQTLSSAHRDAKREELEKLGLIRAFKVCYETLIKDLYRYLRDDVGVSGLNKAPKPIFRKANELKLLESQIEQWFVYVKFRTTTDDYSVDKLNDVIVELPNFIEDADSLYQKLSDTP